MDQQNQQQQQQQPSSTRFSWFPSILSRFIVIIISILSDYVLTDHNAEGIYHT